MTKKVDWSKFYAALERLVVQIPTLAPGEPIDMTTVAHLLVKVQHNRTKLDNTLRKLQQNIGQERRNMQVLQEQRRIRRIEAARSDEVRDLKRKEDRDNEVELQCQVVSAKIALTKGWLEEHEAAKQSVEAMMRTLETAKQTLNSLKQIGLSDRDSLT